MDYTDNTQNTGLTTTEVSNIWSSYLKSTMELRMLEHFFATAEDKEVKNLVESMLNQSNQSVIQLKKIFTTENLTIPLGFTDEDVRSDAHKLFSDTFILFICLDLTMLTMSTYPSAFSDSTRKDIRHFFQTDIESTITIQNTITELMLSQGVYLKHPQVAIDDKIDFVSTINYFNGLLGGSRPLNAPEIANLSRLVHRAQFSKMVFVTFSKIASKKNLMHHFSKGRDGIEKVLTSLEEVLDNENIPISASGDYKIYDVELAPFSDKLMLFFINTCLGIFCFTMVNQAMTSSLRTDVISKLDKISDDMKKYYGVGLLLAVKEQWFEHPPQAVNRKL